MKSEMNIINLTNLKSDEGFWEIPLSIVSVKEIDGYYEYEVKAKVKDEIIGLIIHLKKNLPSGYENESKNIFVKDCIKFISKGSESDKLLNFMASKLLLFKRKNLSFIKSLSFISVNLNHSKLDYEKQDATFKIFLERGIDYAELFVRFHFHEKIIVLSEKDKWYRKSLVRILNKDHYGLKNWLYSKFSTQKSNN